MQYFNLRLTKLLLEVAFHLLTLTLIRSGVLLNTEIALLITFSNNEMPNLLPKKPVETLNIFPLPYYCQVLMLPSSASKSLFLSRPPKNPVSELLEPITLWQGKIIGNGFLPIWEDTALSCESLKYFSLKLL